MCPHILSISLYLNFPKGINGGHKAFLCLWQRAEMMLGEKIRNKNKSGHLPEMRCIRWRFMLLMSLSCISKFSLQPGLSSILAMSETLIGMKSKFLLCTVQTCLCWPRWTGPCEFSFYFVKWKSFKLLNLKSSHLTITTSRNSRLLTNIVYGSSSQRMVSRPAASAASGNMSNE